MSDTPVDMPRFDEGRLGPKRAPNLWLYVGPVLILLLGVALYLAVDLLRQGALSAHTTEEARAEPPPPRPLALTPAPGATPLKPAPAADPGAAPGPTGPAEQAGSPPSDQATPDDLQLLVALRPPPAEARPVKAAVHHKASGGGSPLLREWAKTKTAFARLERSSPCDGPGMPVVCSRYKQLVLELDEGASTQTDEQLMARVKDLHRLIQSKAP